MVAAANRSRVTEGLPHPLGATWDGPRRQLRAVLRQRHQGRALPVRRRRRERARADRAAGIHRRGLARLPAGCAARAPSTAIASTAPTSRSRATASTRTSCCSTPTPRRIVGELTGTRRCSATRWRRGRPDLRRARQRAVHAEMRASSTRRSPGATTGRRTCRGTTPSSTKPTCAASPSCTPACPRQLRGTFRGLATPEVIELHQVARRHRGRAAAGPHVRQRQPSARKGTDELLGLQHHRLLRARSALRLRARFRLRRVQGDGRAASTTPASRSSSTSSTTTPPRATSAGRRCRSRASTTPATTGCCRTEALLHQRHRHREHAQPEPSARHPDGHRQPALLGAGDACRWLPLRPRHHPGARAQRLRPAERLPRAVRPGPGAERR